MRISAYLDHNRLTPEEFAARIGSSEFAVRSYRDQLRIPRPYLMTRIYFATGGLVTANDFYDLPPAHLLGGIPLEAWEAADDATRGDLIEAAEAAPERNRLASVA